MCRISPVGVSGLTAAQSWDALLDDTVELAYRGSEPARPSRTQSLPAELHPSLVEVYEVP